MFSLFSRLSLKKETDVGNRIHQRCHKGEIVLFLETGRGDVSDANWFDWDADSLGIPWKSSRRFGGWKPTNLEGVGD